MTALNEQRARDLGERALIERFTAGVVPERNVVGFTDDAALLDLGAGDYLVATTDAYRAATHFPDAMTWHERGAFVIEGTVSDLAAMGASPRAALLALGAPVDFPVRDLDAFRDGVLAALDRVGAELAGGDTKEADTFTATATALGTVPRDRPLRRSGARPTDLIAVTGALGGAGAGLAALNARGDAAREDAARLLRPRARLAEGRALADTRGTCTAAADSSDGFSTALAAIADAAGGLGFVVDASRLPVAPEARRVAADDAQALEWALHAGGDYELVVTLERTEVLDAVHAVRAAGGDLTVVGHVTSTGEPRVVQHADGREARLEAAGWRHFRA